MRSLWNPKSTNFVKVICGKDGGGGIIIIILFKQTKPKESGHSNDSKSHIKAIVVWPSM